MVQMQSTQPKQRHNRIDESLVYSKLYINDIGEQSTTKINGYFLHSQLLIDCLLRMPPSSTVKNDFISQCKKKYEDNESELKIIDEFEKDYFPEHALQWYTRPSFLYCMLSKALRVQDIDELFLLRFLIRDIEGQLHQNRCTTSVTLYRGQLMSNNELQLLKGAVRQFISINQFFSTTKDPAVAIILVDDTDANDDKQRVIFKIDANPDLDDIKPFADISQFSHIQDEQEVLMMPGTIFRIDDIHFAGNRLWNIHITLCSSNDHELKSILDHMINEDDDDATGLLSLGHVLCNMGKYDDAAKYYRRLLNELPDDHEDIADCYYSLGNVALKQGNFDIALIQHLEALRIKERILKPDDPLLACSYNSIGDIYKGKEDTTQALKWYKKALVIYEQNFNDYPHMVAGCLSNLGCVYERQKNYPKALERHHKALWIRQKCRPAGHSDIGDSHNNIANIHRWLGQYTDAIQQYNQSLEICRKTLPPQHPDTALRLENLGRVYVDIGELQQALPFLNQAVTMYGNTLLPDHPYIKEIENFIQYISSQLK